MSAVFFRKKLFVMLGAITLLCSVFGVYLYTRYLDNATVEAVSQNYYFLVSDSTSVEASTYEIQLNGGAGYLMEQDGREYVAISTYLTEIEAQTVQKNWKEDTKIFTVGSEKLYFKKQADKKNAKKIIGAFHTLEDIIEVLHLEINRLEKGATQESCKRILQTLEKQFAFLENEYEGFFPKYSKICQTAIKRLEKMINDTVFVKDLRYLQCELCEAYATLAKDFAL